jgi:hypothetical protein
VEDRAWDDARHALSRPWHELVSAEGLNVSLLPEFVHAAASAKGRLDDLRVLAGWRGGQLVAIVPYYLQRTRMLRVPMSEIGLAGNFVSYHQELAALGCAYELLLALLSDRRRGWDFFCAAGGPSDGATAVALRRVARELGFAVLAIQTERSPYLPIESSSDEFLAAKSSKFRSNLRRREQLLREARLRRTVVRYGRRCRRALPLHARDRGQ